MIAMPMEPKIATIILKGKLLAMTTEDTALLTHLHLRAPFGAGGALVVFFSSPMSISCLSSKSIWTDAEKIVLQNPKMESVQLNEREMKRWTNKLQWRKRWIEMTKTKKLHRNVATRCNCNQRWPQTERRRRFSLPPLAMQPTFEAVEDVRFCTQWCNKPKRGSRRKISKFDSINSHSAQLECDSHSKPSLSLPLFPGCFRLPSLLLPAFLRTWVCAHESPTHTHTTGWERAGRESWLRHMFTSLYTEPLSLYGGESALKCMWFCTWFHHCFHRMSLSVVIKIR